jgi:IS30 family transposase
VSLREEREALKARFFETLDRVGSVTVAARELGVNRNRAYGWMRQAGRLSPGRGGRRREVATALRTGRTRRKPQKRPDQRTPRFVDQMVMISERPPEVEDRAVPGHWEGDLIVGTRSESAIVTLVERATRYVMLGHLPGGHTAEETS